MKPAEQRDLKLDHRMCKGERRMTYLERVFGALGRESEGKGNLGLFELNN